MSRPAAQSRASPRLRRHRSLRRGTGRAIGLWPRSPCWRRRCPLPRWRRHCRLRRHRSRRPHTLSRRCRLPLLSLAPSPRSARCLPARTCQSSPGAERRQLTILFCDVMDSTTLAGQLDPEDFREVMVRYHATCTEVIQRYGGHVAQYLGDGLLAYFGWPQAHEDDARRAVHTGLALVTAIRALGNRLIQDYGMRLAVRIGMHTGLVVVGTGEDSAPYGQLAVGATPNLAAKIQSLAAPDTVVISAATYDLVQGYFLCEPLGAHTLPGTTAAQCPVPGAGREWGARTPGRHPAAAAHAVCRARGGTGSAAGAGRAGAAGAGAGRPPQWGRGDREIAPGAGGHNHPRGRGLYLHCTAAVRPTINTRRCIRSSSGCSAVSKDDAETPVSERLARLETLVEQAQLDGHTSVPLLAALVQLELPEERYPALQLTPQQQRQRTFDIWSPSSSGSPRGSRCSFWWKTCTGWIPPPWNGWAS